MKMEHKIVKWGTISKWYETILANGWKGTRPLCWVRRATEVTVHSPPVMVPTTFKSTVLPTLHLYFIWASSLSFLSMNSMQKHPFTPSYHIFMWVLLKTIVTSLPTPPIWRGTQEMLYLSPKEFAFPEEIIAMPPTHITEIMWLGLFLFYFLYQEVYIPNLLFQLSSSNSGFCSGPQKSSLKEKILWLKDLQPQL